MDEEGHEIVAGGRLAMVHQGVEEGIDQDGIPPGEEPQELPPVDREVLPELIDARWRDAAFPGLPPDLLQAPLIVEALSNERVSFE